MLLLSQRLLSRIVGTLLTSFPPWDPPHIKLVAKDCSASCYIWFCHLSTSSYLPGIYFPGIAQREILCTWLPEFREGANLAYNRAFPAVDFIWAVATQFYNYARSQFTITQRWRVFYAWRTVLPDRSCSWTAEDHANLTKESSFPHRVEHNRFIVLGNNLNSTMVNEIHLQNRKLFWLG